MKKKWYAAMLAVIMAVAIGIPAQGQTDESAGTPAQTRNWKIEITPYIWYAGLEGDVTFNGQEYDFEKSASDLFDALDVGGSLLGVVQYKRFLFWGQVDYFSLSTDELDAKDQPERASLDTDMLLGEAAVGYQINGFWEGQTFDLLVGVRTLHIENDLEVDSELLGKKTFSRDNDVTDPIFVVRPSIPIFPSKIKGLRFNPTLAIGGGGDSDLVYELFPQLQYQITDNIAARLGYRTVGYKFTGDDNEDNELNFRLSGLIAGVGVTF